MGISTVFLIFSGVCVIGTLYLQYELPETENKSLEEIEKTFKSKNTSNDDEVVLKTDKNDSKNSRPNSL